MKTVAVIFGSRSAEHDVSVVTAIASIIKPLELSGQFNVEAVYISKDGSWYWDQKLKDITLYSSGEIEEFMRRAPKVHLLFENGLTLVKSSQFAGRKMYKKIDVVFPATHGTHGEDGELMGLLEMANVPYVGCGVLASSIAMDKVVSKLLVSSQGIPTPKMRHTSSHDYSKDPSVFIKEINDSLTFPVFVKPAHLGSSIGISKVDTPSGLVNAIEVALHYDDKVLVEEAVPNLIELTLPIIGNEALTPALLEQPNAKTTDFFDFETKYMQGGKKGKSGKTQKGSQGYSTIPADIPNDLYAKAEQLGLQSYKALGCSGIARIDMLVDRNTGSIFFNEANPLPGGLYAHNWRMKGLSNIELVQRLVALAFEKHESQSRLHTSFQTNYLRQF